MFGDKNNQLTDYAKIQLIFAKWRLNMPEHYRSLIDFYQEKADELTPILDKPFLRELVVSYKIEDEKAI